MIDRTTDAYRMHRLMSMKEGSLLIHTKNFLSNYGQYRSAVAFLEMFFDASLCELTTKKQFWFSGVILRENAFSVEFRKILFDNVAYPEPGCNKVGIIGKSIDLAHLDNLASLSIQFIDTVNGTVEVPNNAAPWTLTTADFYADFFKKLQAIEKNKPGSAANKIEKSLNKVIPFLNEQEARHYLQTQITQYTDELLNNGVLNV